MTAIRGFAASIVMIALAAGAASGQATRSDVRRPSPPRTPSAVVGPSPGIAGPAAPGVPRGSVQPGPDAGTAAPTDQGASVTVPRIDTPPTDPRSTSSPAQPGSR
jgi:hypothetical protein